VSIEGPDRLEESVRDGMVRQLRQNLAKCRKVILDEKMDLKTRERWTQLYNNTSQVLNQILKDRQMRDWEKRLREIEKYRGIQKRTVQSETDPPDSNTTSPEQ
jgi:hypothetical protein